jgi:pre-mRNA-splicing factor ISY1
MMKNIDADYYGYMDDDDGLLVPNEEKCEKEAIKKKIEQWKTTETTNDIDIDETYVLPEMNVNHIFYIILFILKKKKTLCLVR